MPKRVRLFYSGQKIPYEFYNLPWHLLQEPIQVRYHDKPISPDQLTDQQPPLATEPLLERAVDLGRRYGPDEYPVVVCDARLQDEIFAHHEPWGAVISTWSTKRLSTRGVEKYLMYVLANVISNTFVDIPYHPDTLACPSDECDRRSDVTVGLDTGQYCHKCRTIILQAIAAGKMLLRDFAAISRILDWAADRQYAFVLMPFSPPFTRIYNEVLRPTLEEAGWLPQRADDIFEPREIVNLIVEQIFRASLIVADLTGRNPNVFYELGLAHAYERPTVLLCQDIGEVPFDLRHRQVVEYTDTAPGLRKLKQSLRYYLGQTHNPADRAVGNRKQRGSRRSSA